jgi:hypothetical protein
MNGLATLYAFIAALYVYVFFYRPRIDMFYNQITPIVKVSPPARLEPQPQAYMGPNPTSNQGLTTYIVSQPAPEYPPPMMTPQTAPSSLVPPVVGPLLSMFTEEYSEEPFAEDYADIE